MHNRPKAHKRKRHPKLGNSRGRSRRPARIEKIRPGVDSQLKEALSQIGTPDRRPFRPDPFQLEAVRAIENSDCLVCVPTGAGKTWVAQKAMEIVTGGGNAWYASPLKALSNAKYLEFSHIFGPNQVGILTGDRKENPDASIIVGTTEILRNQLYDAMHRGETLSVDLVVLDEAHFLGDPDRGVVWEEIMIYLPARIPLLMLSATIGNAGQIAKWLTAVRGKQCVVIQESKRPVPLAPIVFHPSGMLTPLTIKNVTGKARLHKKVQELINNPRPPILSKPGKLPPFGDILRVLRRYNLLPAIFFLKSRADCDGALQRCETNLISNPARRSELNQAFARLADQSPRIAMHRQRGAIENLAVGAHHSGQLPSWKIVIETLMTQGLLDAVFATSTVAAGVNFPARTVVFLNSDRFNGKMFKPLSATEFHQMTGRAGRRGLDRIGFAMAVPGRYMDLGYVASLICAPASNVDSQIHINFSMVLNLLLSHTPSQIADLLRLSFSQFQGAALSSTGRKKRTKPPDDHLQNDFQRHLAFLEKLGYVDSNGALTDVGIWTAQLRVDHPLLISEGFRYGLLPESDPALLAAVIAMFVYDREGDEQVDRQLLPTSLMTALLTVRNGLKPLLKQMNKQNFPIRPLMLTPAAAILGWAGGTAWEQVMIQTGMREGDLAMLALRTADHLRHIRALKAVFPNAAQSAGAAIDQIVRDPVLTEY
ncbi:MAG: DEAD/DEAH box helicase [Deltaproteobacteria bacterium]|nr:DEAD/DEAH box helicase [Deltaproteobacteria bacterium]